MEVVTDPMPYITNGLIPGTKNKNKREQDSNTNETQNTVQKLKRDIQKIKIGGTYEKIKFKKY